MNKRKLTNVVLVLIFLVGLSLLLYPTISATWNKYHSARAIDTYSEQVTSLDHQDYADILEEAREYNETLYGNVSRFKLSDEELQIYNEVLNPFGTGVMGYVEIPSINTSLPIYHGTDESVLQVAAGHIEGTSLPIGGESTHSAISGHRGLPSAKLFTDIVKLKVGDTFTIHILDEVYTYEVDRILTVEPNDISGLEIEEGIDYSTLITCTPYGINTHRLLVRGHRVSSTSSSRVTNDGRLIEPIVVASAIAIPIFIIILVVMMIRTHRKKKGKK